MASPLRLLLAGSETIDDRRLIESFLGLPRDAAIDVPVGLNSANMSWLGGDDVLVVAQLMGPTYVPLRLGQLRRVEGSSVNSGVRVTLTDYPLVGDLAMIQSYLELHVKDLGPRLTETAPPLAAASDQEDAWGRSVLALAEGSPVFGTTCFLIASRIDTSSRSTRIQLAARAAVHTASLGEGLVMAIDDDGSTIELFPLSDAMEIDLGSEVGAVRFEVQHQSLTGQLARFLLPAHRPTQSLQAGPRPTVEHERRSVPSPHAYDTYSFLVSQVSLSPAARAEIAERLGMLTPGDRRLAVQRAKALLEAGEPSRAVDVLRDVPEGERTSEIHALMVDAVLSTGDVEAAEPHLVRAAFDAWTFDQLVQAVEGLGQSVRDGLVTRLCTVLGSERMAELVSRVGDRLSPGPQLGTIARRVAEASPSDALALLNRAGQPDEMPTEILPLIIDLRLTLDPASVGEPAIELTERLVRMNNLEEAANTAARVASSLDWREAGAVAELLIDGLQKLGPSEWSDQRDYQAFVAADLATSAIRGARDVDLLDAFDIAVRFRQALSPLSPTVAAMLDGLDEELRNSWEASEAHRLAIEELAENKMQALRDAFARKRLLIVGGRISAWWDPLLEDLALDRNSSWVEVEPGRRPSQDVLKARVSGGKTSLLVVMIDYIGHSTSAIGDFARDRKIPTIESRSGRASFIRALERALPQLK